VVLELGVFYFISFSFFFFFYSYLLIPSLLSFYPYSHPLHFPSFSCTAIHCSPSQLLFLALLIHSFPCLHFPSYPPLNLSPHYTPPHTQHLLTNLLYQMQQLHLPEIPDTNTLHYNKRNTQKHTKWSQILVAPIPLNPHTHPFSQLPFYLVSSLPILQKL
jgi:hypothetical protein